MKIAIIKYNAGNVFSVSHCLQRLGVTPLVTSSTEELLSADKVIFPGVGEAKNTMLYLRQQHLDQVIKDLKQPVLGICLGMQLMCRHSEEGNVGCLDIFHSPVKKFPANPGFKIPHMGWNTLHHTDEALFKGIPQDAYAYFVHSYYVPVNSHTAAQTEYVLPFSAALHKDNFYATQFHPEKSGNIGELILKNFLNLEK